jgi:hypothetical protein
MGNFYTNFTARSADRDAVVSTLSTIGRVAYVTPPNNGNTMVYDRQSDEQDFSAIELVGTRLSLDLDAPVLAILNHDDDILCYWLFQSGQLVDEYNSCPSYFDEMSEEPAGPTECDAQKLCDAFGCSQDADRVNAILQKSSFDDGYVFAVDRHGELVNALGLPDAAVGTGYNYIENGELPEGLNGGDLAHVT